jgi:hypothetical protein
MTQPSVSAIPSFGHLLTQDEKAQDQTIDVVTTNIENTQFVTVSFDNNVFVEQMANNSATIAVGSTYLTPLIDAAEYTINASVSNIYGDVAIGPTTAFQFTVMPAAGSGSTTGGAAIHVRDENIPLGIVTTFNFTGLGVTASVTGQTARVSVAGTLDAGEY